MRKFYWLYGAIAVVLIVLKIVGLIGWWAATSFIWFPIAVVLSDSLVMVITTDVGQYLKHRKESKEIPSCANCIWKSLQTIDNEEQCYGEKKGVEKKDGKCAYYHRSEVRKH